MKNPLIPFVATLALMAGPVFAQETTSDTSTETASEEAQPSEKFLVAEDLNEPQIGQGYLNATHEKWEVRCIKAEEGVKEECRLFNLLSDKEGNAIAQIDMQSLPKGNKAVAGIEIATPLGSMLTAQIQLKIDAGKSKRYPYLWCDSQGCYGRFGMTAGEIASMKKGAKAVVTIVSVGAPDEPILMELSLKGFTAAWNQISAE